MKIVCTFVKNLTSFKYSEDEPNELERLLLDLWNDIEYLEQFFEQNRTDLSQYFNVTVEQAITRTRKDVGALTDRLIRLSDEKSEGFDSLFENLDNHHYKLKPLEEQKAKKSWLRLYAIRIDANCYVITGGAIKLTPLMKDRDHTNEELKKLGKCKTYLQANGILDEDSYLDFIELEL